MTDHGIPATSWQLEAAAAGRLRAIVLPLLPEPEFDGLLWKWHPTHLEVLSVWSEGMPFPSVRLLDYQVGDHIYLQEEWAISEGGLTLYRSDGDDGLEYCNASTMPPEEAQDWFVIVGVQVQQSLTIEQCELVGLIDVSDEDTVAMAMIRQGQFKERWNVAHSEYPWHPDRWVILLDVVPVEAPE